MMGEYTESNLDRLIIRWGFGLKENDMEGVASLLCPWADSPKNFKVVEVDSKEDFNPKEPCWF